MNWDDFFENPYLHNFVYSTIPKPTEKYTEYHQKTDTVACRRTLLCWEQSQQNSYFKQKTPGNRPSSFLSPNE